MSARFDALAGAERLPKEAIAARRRPRAVLAAFALEAFVAWLLAGPWAELVGAIWGQHPEGDRALWWQAGLVDAADFVVRQRPALQALVASTAWGLALWFLLSIVLLGALSTALSTRGATFSAAIARGLQLFPRLAWLQVFALFVQTVTLGALLVFPIALATAGDPRPGLELGVALLAALLSGLASLWLAALVDLARALATRWDVGAGRALVLAIRAPTQVARLALLSAPRLAASLGLLGFGAAITASARTVLVIAVAHQLVAFGRVALRASVLARALRLSDDAFEGEPSLDDAADEHAPAAPAAAQGAP